MKRADIILSGEFVITDPHVHPLRDAAVVICGGHIEEVAGRDEIFMKYTAATVIERSSGLVMPGLLNAHTHIPMTLFRGLADDLPLRVWLEEHIFPREARLTPELIRLGTELGLAEMIRSGTTSFIDMYLFEDHICEVVDRVGLRAWLGEGLFDFPSPSFPSGFDALKETERLLEKWKRHPRISITVDPHTPYTCSPELLRAARSLWERHGEAMLVIHVAETGWEAEEIRRRYGKGPIAHLDDLGLLTEQTMAVHVVHPSEDGMEILKARGVKVVHCAESNLKLASGIAPIPRMLDAGIEVLIGTDGAASNNNLDMLEEMGTVARLHKGVECDPTTLPARQVLSMATEMAGKAMGIQGLGQLVPGAPADVICVELDAPHLRPCYNPVSQVVYCASACDVRDVICDGQLLMEDFQLKTIDEEALFQRIKEVAIIDA